MRAERKIIIPIVLCLFALVSTVGAAERNYSLILAEFGKDSDGQQTQTLVRYHFKSGLLAEKESVLTARTADLRFDLGGNQIYDNRYVITMWGDVIDLATKQVLFKSSGTLVGIDKDSHSVLIRADGDDETGIYAFDLKSHQYLPWERPELWVEGGVMSPNGQLSASGDGGKIWLHRPNGKKVLLGSDFWRKGTSLCSDMAKPTFIWVDDTHLLTLRGNGRLSLVDVKGKVAPLLTIPDADHDAALCGPELLRDGKNQIYYRGGRNAWSIDVVQRAFEPFRWEGIGDGFEVDYQWSFGHIIRYQGKPIGQWWCTSPHTAPGHIAIEFGPADSNLGYPEGVKVWSSESNVWSTIKPEWLTAIVGWAEE
jgi:hypothetical protein